MASEWQTSPDVREQFDAGFAALLKKAEQVELQINRGDVTEEEIQRLLVDLNVELRELGYQQATVMVTGRIRHTTFLTDYLRDTEKDVEELFDDVFPELELDLRGQHYKVTHFPLHLIGFNEQTTEIRGFESIDGLLPGIYRHLVLDFSKAEDYPEDTAWFTLQIGDIENIQLPHMSDRSEEREITELLPDIKEKIDVMIKQINAAKNREKAILEALDDFEVTIDWSKIDGAGHTRMSIIDMLERYLTRQLDFDETEPYFFWIGGKIVGKQADLEPIVSEYYRDTPRILYIKAMRLWTQAGTEDLDTKVTYVPVFYTLEPVPERDGGRTPYFIATDSVKRYKTTRPNPESLPFRDAETLIKHGETKDEEPPEVAHDGASLKDTESLVELFAAEQAAEDEAAEAIDPGVVLAMAQELLGETKRETLEKAEHALNLFAERCRELSAKTFSDRDEFLATMRELNLMIAAFGKFYDTIEVPIEVFGEGVLVPQSTLSIIGDSREHEFSIVMKGTQLVAGNITTSQCGIYEEVKYFRSENDEKGIYSFRVGMLLRDVKANAGTQLTLEGSTMMPIAVVDVRKYIQVSLDKSAYFRIPELEVIRNREDALSNWTGNGELSDHAGVEEVLRQVQAELCQEEVLQELKALSSLDQLKEMCRHLALSRDESDPVKVATMERVGHVVARVLRDLLTPDRGLVIKGGVYAPDGGRAPMDESTDPNDTGYACGVVDVIYGYRALETIEPILVVYSITESEKEQVRYVPFSQIEQLLI